MRTITCPTDKSLENEKAYFKRHAGRNKVLAQRGEDVLVTDNAENNPGGTIIAETDDLGNYKEFD